MRVLLKLVFGNTMPKALHRTHHIIWVSLHRIQQV